MMLDRIPDNRPLHAVLRRVDASTTTVRDRERLMELFQNRTCVSLVIGLAIGFIFGLVLALL